MNEQLILETPELRAEMERLRPIVGQAVEDAIKSVEAAPIDALWVLVKAMTFVMGGMGHDGIADVLVLVFQRKLEWPRVPSSDARIVGPIGDVLWKTLDMATWSQFEGEDDLEFGRRAVVILGVLIEIITDVIGQIWGPEKEEYIIGILQKVSEQSVVKIAAKEIQ
jgi:hypothetical protein